MLEEIIVSKTVRMASRKLHTLAIKETNFVT